MVGEEQHVYAAALQAEGVSWIGAPPAAEEFAATCKIRYRHQPVGCRVRLLADERCEVRFDQPQKAITPGQALVFYRGDEVLGGGRIVGRVVRAKFERTYPDYQGYAEIALQVAGLLGFFILNSRYCAAFFRFSFGIAISAKTARASSTRFSAFGVANPSPSAIPRR